MTTLKQVSKEDLEEGANYIYEYLKYDRLLGVVDEGEFFCSSYQQTISKMNGQFYGPIELGE